MRRPLWVVFPFLVCAADARVISYAPVTSGSGVPAVQLRTNRHYALVEADDAHDCPVWAPVSRLVVYDSTGADAPRVVFPPSGTTTIVNAAAFEAEGVLRLVLTTDAPIGGGAPGLRTLYSPDSGATWKRLDAPHTLLYLDPTATDLGGPLAGGGVTRQGLSPGTREVPFVWSTWDAIHAVRADGTAGTLVAGSPGLALVGTNRERTRFVVAGRTSKSAELGFSSVDLEGRVTPILTVSGYLPYVRTAWLDGPGRLYLFVYGAPAPFPEPNGLFVVEGGHVTALGSASYVVPTEDFRGAWIVERGPGQPTVLSRHTKETGRVVQWSDPTGPELEAVHPGASQDTLLLQVHRPRLVADPRLPTFRDPALAIWQMGEPPPAAYDELFLIEDWSKGFVHLDVDAAAAGAPFVFDSGAGGARCFVTSGGPSPGSGGGGDVIQEWGVVRGSLRQTLVIPAVARARGAFGSDWKSELVLHNPNDAAVDVAVTFVPSGAEVRPQSLAVVSLAPREIRVVPDVLASLFGLESGAGALLLQPADAWSISATSRTSSTNARGSFGMGVGAIDVMNAAGPRFPLTFAGALLGDGFRSNLAAVDASGHGLAAALRLRHAAGESTVTLTVPAGGQEQANDLAALAGLPRWTTASLRMELESGEAIPALIAIDNRTNDPTYFPPDLPAPFVRTIPALVHGDGAAGARFRSDLLLSNTSDELATVTLAAKPWTSSDAEREVTLTLLPRESKLVRDALLTVFGMSGVARLRFIAGSSLTFAPNDTGVRVTSRTYTLLEDGGTYGLLLPPLNSFQSAAAGETLEILGARGGAGYRTNLSLVDLTPSADGSSARVVVEIVDAHGGVLDSFETTVPIAGGRQVDDLFRARFLGDGPAAALIRVRPSGGLVAAYATLIDQGTNDPVYLPADLAAR